MSLTPVMLAPSGAGFILRRASARLSAEAWEAAL